MRLQAITSLVVAVWLMVAAPAGMASGSGGVNAPEQRKAPHLVLVSIDGFRYDFQDLHETPALDRIAARGVRAERMIPVFPTLTFPNHYSIATGLYPANHGLIGNTFPNRERTEWYSISDRESVETGDWYGGEPVWVAAEKAGMVTAAYFFVGTEAAIQGVPLTHWKSYDESVPGSEKVEQVLDWLSMPEETRPHFVTLYFADVDTAAHDHGPESAESVAAVERVDAWLGTLLDGLDALEHGGEVYLVVVSDHGLRATDPTRETFIMDQVFDIEGLSIVQHGSVAFIYVPHDQPARAAEIRDSINAEWKHGHALLRYETPQKWHVTEASGFAEVIVQADPGHLVFSSADRVKWRSAGGHGWVPEDERMHGIFLASGPRLPKGERVGPVRVVDVYPLMMEILGLPITTRVDGDPETLVPLLD